MCIRDRQREVLQIMRDIEFSNGFFDIYEMLRIEDPNGGTPQPRPDTASTSNSRTSREMTPLNRSIENKRPSHMNLGSQGTLLYIIDDETDFSLYDLSKWRLLTTFNLAITSKERYWHHADQTKSNILMHKSDFVITSCLSDDARLLVVGVEHGLIHVFETNTQRKLFNLEGHKAEITCFILNDDASSLISASRDVRVYIWDILKEEKVDAFTEHSFAVKHINYIVSLDNDEVIASADESGVVLVWNLDNKHIIHRMKTIPSATYHVHKTDYKILVAAYQYDQLGYIRMQDENAETHNKIKQVFKTIPYDIVRDVSNLSLIHI
eukprot:TRINITY_DN1968_c0_g1_i6.p1 TRINITY_DN1968_c0_g1~~TRINITY_DN1968_c0_g1_i6.p1  ORF type:complete len:339 (-),score=57.88 TRINITY_DN1968_c0_g1_i6:127-1095(-)